MRPRRGPKKRRRQRVMWSALVCAGLGLACVMFASPARAAAAAPEYRNPSAASASAESAADAARVRDSRITSERTGAPEQPRGGAQPSAGAKVRNSVAMAPRRGLATPPHGIHPGANGSADRVRSLMNRQVRGHLASQARGPIGSNRAAADRLGLPRPNSVGAATAPTLAASKHNALPVTAAAATRNSSIGGPQVQSSGRLGGAAVARTAVGRSNHSAAIDGTQFHRKF